MRIIFGLLAVLLAASEARISTKKGKGDPYSYSSITAVYFPDEAGANALCRALECKDGQLCVVYHDDRAICMQEKTWKKLITNKRSELQKKNLARSPAKKIPSLQNDCQPCPVVHPVFVCGSDNVTYSSDCRLQFKNCEDNTSVKVACQGRCPCPAPVKNEPFDGVSSVDVLDSKSHARSRKALMKQKAMNATETDNHVDIQHSGKGVGKSCSKKEMRELKRRLVDWFWTIFRQKFPEGKPMELADAPVCNRGASQGILSWMFSYFDDNKDGSLTLTELFDLESDKYEHCINPFLDHCDVDKDLEVSGHEWCRCLQKH